MAHELTDFAEICIPSVSLQADGYFHKYPLFQLQGKNANGSFECSRKLKDFYKMRGRFVRKWPGLMVPMLPAKKRIDTFGEKRLEKLRHHLEVFMRLIIRVQELCISEEFLMFISPAVSDFATFLKTVTVPQVSDILVNFQLMSHESGSGSVGPEALVQLAEARIQFTIAKDHLRSTLKCSKAGKKALDDYLSYTSKFKEAITALEAEQLSYFSGSWSPIYPRDASVETKNPWATVEEWAFEQVIEVDTILEAIASREELERLKQQHAKTIEGLQDDLQKLKYSEATSSWLHLKPKFEKVAEAGDRLEQAEADLWSLSQLIEVVCFRLIMTEIPAAKKRLAGAYRQIMSTFSQETVLQLSPLCQLAADIKNALAADTPEV